MKKHLSKIYIIVAIIVLAILLLFLSNNIFKSKDDKTADTQITTEQTKNTTQPKKTKEQETEDQLENLENELNDIAAMIKQYQTEVLKMQEDQKNKFIAALPVLNAMLDDFEEHFDNYYTHDNPQHKTKLQYAFDEVWNAEKFFETKKYLAEIIHNQQESSIYIDDISQQNKKLIFRLEYEKNHLELTPHQQHRLQYMQKEAQNNLLRMDFIIYDQQDWYNILNHLKDPELNKQAAYFMFTLFFNILPQIDDKEFKKLITDYTQQLLDNEKQELQKVENKPTENSANTQEK